jgi:xanthine dehydrogenase large subunit
MLAFSVREALRAAVAAFGGGAELASPATPEQVFWAIERGPLKASQSARTVAAE